MTACVGWTSTIGASYTLVRGGRTKIRVAVIIKGPTRVQTCRYPGQRDMSSEQRKDARSRRLQTGLKQPFIQPVNVPRIANLLSWRHRARSSSEIYYSITSRPAKNRASCKGYRGSVEA